VSTINQSPGLHRDPDPGPGGGPDAKAMTLVYSIYNKGFEYGKQRPRLGERRRDRAAVHRAGADRLQFGVLERKVFYR